MAAKAKTETAEGFVGSVAKFSIATFITFGISGLVLLLTNFLLPDKTLSGELIQFTTTTNTIMTIVIFGLDQSFIRFFNEPPGKLSGKALFRLCFYLSVSILFAAALAGSLMFPGQLYASQNFKLLGSEIIPLLFLNAFFWMVARYFYVLFRMQQHILYYTVVSVLMNFFFRLFHILGAFFTNSAFALAVMNVVGLGIFALFLLLWNRKEMIPKRQDFDWTAIKTVVPFGAAVAPTEIMRTLNSTISLAMIAGFVNEEARGVYGYAILLSGLVTSIQGGFASFWGAYMYENYKTHQKRIIKMHDYLNLVVLVFFCLLIAFEDIIFWVLAAYSAAKPIFPIMMLAAVFTILCETTVYGITIARRPIFDTIGIALSFFINIGALLLLATPLGLMGAAIALAVANFCMFLFRTVVAQRFYRSIENPLKTVVALALSILVTVLGTVWTHHFFLRLAACVTIAALYALLYLPQVKHLCKTGLSIAKNLLARNKV